MGRCGAGAAALSGRARPRSARRRAGAWGRGGAEGARRRAREGAAILCLSRRAGRAGEGGGPEAPSLLPGAVP